jgi:uncharacterized protein (DUF1778 family)
LCLPHLDFAPEVEVASRIVDTRRVPREAAKRDVRITLRLPADLATQIGEAAKADRRTRSDWIVIQLEDAIARLAKKARKAKE